jgi:hypothetical protein
MNPVFNQNLFRHKNTSSSQLNNLCTVIHKFKSEGSYLGEVFLGKTHMGSFTVRCSKNFANPQVNVDASMFDRIYANSKKLATVHNQSFEVRAEGFIVFYASGHHDGFYLTLKRAGEKEPENYFDSRKLSDGDMIAIRLIYPGEYELKNEPGNQSMNIFVRKAEDGKYHHPSKLPPKTIDLADRGFPEKNLTLEPLQALVINAKVDCSIKLQSKERPPKTEKKKFAM